MITKVGGTSAELPQLKISKAPSTLHPCSPEHRTTVAEGDFGDVVDLDDAEALGRCLELQLQPRLHQVQH